MMGFVRRIASLILLTCFLATGTGWLGSVHNQVHAAEDAALAEQGLPVDRHHDTQTCQIHAILAGPMISDGAVPILIALGLFVAFLTELRSAALRRAPLAVLHTRGPPAR